MSGMGLRSLVAIVVVQTLVLYGLNANTIRERRDASITVDNNPNKRDVVIYSASSPSERNSYHLPLLAAPPAASVARAVSNNGYQPPLLSAPSNDYKPLISSSQTQSIRYQAPGNTFPIQGLSLPHGQSQPSESSHSYSAPLLASAQTGNANTVPLQHGSRQAYAYTGDHGPTNNFNHQPPLQAESQPAAASVPINRQNDGSRQNEGNRQNNEYVVYYYYYYDNDTAANGSSNFDDIPSLESYDSDKNAKEPEKSASARTLAADVNALKINEQDHRIPDRSISSQPRSASSAGTPNQPPFIRSDKPVLVSDEVPTQPLKPVSNVYRYGANEVPRLPILPNFVVSEPPNVVRTGISVNHNYPSDDTTTILPVLPNSYTGSHVVHVSESESDDDNDVLVQPGDSKSEDNKIAVEEQATTTITEPTTTTEIPTTTTTEKSRRRPGTGNRRRFNPSPSFTPNRRQPSARSSTTSTSTTTTPSSLGASSTRGSFRGSNRVRTRPTIASTRPRPSVSRSAPSVSDNEDSNPSTVSVSTSTTSRPRFGASSPAPRRFSSTRTRTQPLGNAVRPSSSTTTTTTLRPRSSAPRPRPNIISSRSRPARPGLFRSRTPEPEETETTTSAVEPATEEESPLPSPNQNSAVEENENNDDLSNEDEASDNTEPEEPTTTEKSRFSALFRPRNRSTLNRPKPPLDRRSR